jgi:hypothetical protein
MIVVWGSLDDDPVDHVCSLLEARGAPYAQLDDCDLEELRADVTVGSRARGWLAWPGATVQLEHLHGMYVRPTSTATPQRRRAAMVVQAAASTVDAVVVNRPAAGSSNHSKPYQLMLIAQHGLAVPETLATTDPTAARAFVQSHGRVVYKSLSGVRSIVSSLRHGVDDDRLDEVTSGPVQLQRWVEGTDVRAHIVGTKWFAHAIECDADDYRYPGPARPPVIRPFDLPTQLGEHLVTLTTSLGLLVSGIDLRLAPDGTWYCFEVNPSPGYTYYEERTGQPIGSAIVDLLLTSEV